MRRFVLSICVCLITSLAFASEGSRRMSQDTSVTENFAIYYRFDDTRFDQDYLSNSETAARIRNYLIHSPRIDSITIFAWASPEGAYHHNVWLSQERVKTAREFLLSNSPDSTKLNSDKIKVSPLAENWPGLEQLVDENYRRHDREKVLKILRTKGIGDETRKWRLKQLDGGYTWNYLLRHYMPKLRTATWICVWAETLEPLEKETMMMAQAVVAAPVQLAERTPLPPAARSDRRTILALKTNMLYDAVTALNYAVEVPLGHDLSLQLQQYTPWWLTKSNRQCLQFLSLGAEFRWWFKSDETLQGHFIGAHAWSGKGDMQWNRTGCWQFEFWSAGVSYGYSMPIGRWANLEFSISAGYASIPYCHYIPTDDWEILIKDNNKAGTLHYFGPTKAEVSLVIPIRVKAGKGGAR